MFFAPYSTSSTCQVTMDMRASQDLGATNQHTDKSLIKCVNHGGLKKEQHWFCDQIHITQKSVLTMPDNFLILLFFFSARRNLKTAAGLPMLVILSIIDKISSILGWKSDSYLRKVTPTVVQFIHLPNLCLESLWFSTCYFDLEEITLSQLYVGTTGGPLMKSWLI